MISKSENRSETASIEKSLTNISKFFFFSMHELNPNYSINKKKSEPSGMYEVQYFKHKDGTVYVIFKFYTILGIQFENCLIGNIFLLYFYYYVLHRDLYLSLSAQSVIDAKKSGPVN